MILINELCYSKTINSTGTTMTVSCDFEVVTIMKIICEFMVLAIV